MKIIHRFKDVSKELEFSFELSTAKALSDSALTIVKDGKGYQADQILHIHTRVDFDTDTMTMLYFCDFIYQE
jgi:hypothetical protein